MTEIVRLEVRARPVVLKCAFAVAFAMLACRVPSRAVERFIHWISSHAIKVVTK